jgi:D-3-phosphoglycerate dehydrogenase/C-terminal binding protein
MPEPRFRVVITDLITDTLEREQAALSDLADVIALGAHHEGELAGRVEDADALIVFHDIAVTRKTIARLTRCRLIVRAGVGFDNVDFAFAGERGIPVANVPDYGTEDVADSAIGMLLALTRGITFFNTRMQSGRGAWDYREAVPLRRLRGRVLGIVGLGRIGGAVALRAKALGLDVAFYDPYVPDARDKSLGVRRVETLAELLAQSHVLSLHCPLTPETRGLIDAAALAQMPRGSYLVNTARGSLVDTAAIAPAIASGQLAGAALDVLRTEPPSDSDPLLLAWRDPQHPAHDRVILNPHAAFYCEEGLVDMRAKACANVRRVLLGEAARNVVN